ncbi:hypothetical protein [Chryseobacterium camelliae]|uniref:hypothetical protein n=1 Tax=Chryseobacterium camelliae TaxID=1265445 RepID=UPI0028596FD2|nr:hypothetical protein [Chryseobacterium camelliae]MDR6513605.1 hypothetical protein [Chryseobacterium camelliae]
MKQYIHSCPEAFFKVISKDGDIAAVKEIDILVKQYSSGSGRRCFSATAQLSSMGSAKALELIDEEPQWRDQLGRNINI